MKIKKAWVVASTSFLCFPSLLFSVISTNIPVYAIESSMDRQETPEFLEIMQETNVEGKASVSSGEQSAITDMSEQYDQIFKFSGEDVRYLNQNSESEIEISAANSTTNFKLTLPKGIEIKNYSDFETIDLVNTDNYGNRSFVITAFHEKKEFRLNLLFTDNGKNQITVEDSRGEISADFLFVNVGNNSNRLNENSTRSTVNVTTAAQFVTAWNNQSVSNMSVTLPVERVLSQAQINSLNQLNRLLTITQNGSVQTSFSPAPAATSPALQLGHSGRLALGGPGLDFRFSPLTGIRGFDIIGGSLEIAGGVYQEAPNGRAINIDVDTLTLERAGVLDLVNNGSSFRANILNLNSNGDRQFYISGQNLGPVGTLNINSPAFFAQGLGGNNFRLWLNLEASVINGKVISSNHTGFNNETWGSVSNFRRLSDSNFGSAIPETPRESSLTLQASPIDGGNPMSGTSSIIPGETTLLTANPNEGFRFVRWEIVSGTTSSIENATNTSTTFTMGSENTVVRAVYERIAEGSIIVNYLDKQGNHLRETETINGPIGEVYSANPKEIPGYYLYENPDNMSGIIQENTQNVDFNYVQIHDKLLNTDFEEPPINTDYEFIKQSDVPGWYTTASDKMIEFGLGPNHNISGPAKGRQFVELNANEPSKLYQLVAYEPGTVLRWRLHHAGRLGIDEMRLSIGNPKQPETIQDIKSDLGSWTLHRGSYIVPDDQLVTYFGFEAVSSSDGNLSKGNLLDNIHFAEPSNLIIINEVNKDTARAGDTLKYNVIIENNGGVPTDRLDIHVKGIENLTIDKNTIIIDGQNVGSDSIKIEEEKLSIAPNVVIENTEYVELSFEAKVKDTYSSGRIDTQVEISYWDEGFDDTSYKAESNNAVTKIETLVPNPLDPLNPEVDVDPENKPELPEDQGLLSIDFASSLHFGNQIISAQDQTYYAQPQRLLNPDGTVNETEERPNYVQISDRRSENERNGWQLSVTQNGQFSNANGHELMGSEIQLFNQELVTVQGGTAPKLQEEPVQRILPNTRKVLLQAEGESGTGTWIYRFGNQASADESVGLHIPKGTNPEATSYSTKLTWELSSVPGN